MGYKDAKKTSIVAQLCIKWFKAGKIPIGPQHRKKTVWTTSVSFTVFAIIKATFSYTHDARTTVVFNFYLSNLFGFTQQLYTVFFYVENATKHTSFWQIVIFRNHKAHLELIKEGQKLSPKLLLMGLSVAYKTFF